MSRSFYIVKYTCKEALASNILYISLFLGLGLFFVTWLAGQLAFGSVQKVCIDISLGVLDLSSVFIAIFLGAKLLIDEVNSKSVYIVLSRGISRSSFYFSKALGVLLVLLLNLGIIAFFSVFVCYLYDVAVEKMILLSVLFIMMKSIILLLLAQIFSLFTRRLISICVTFLLYFCGIFVGDKNILQFANGYSSEILIKYYHYVLPGFYKFNIKDYYLFNIELSLNNMVLTFFYSIFYSLFLICLGFYFFSKKSLD